MAPAFLSQFHISFHKPYLWHGRERRIYPIGSMYGIYANIWGILMVNVSIYTIHGSYGIWIYFNWK